jgi:CubicO group peptidase (beta-lactamase class C family)
VVSLIEASELDLATTARSVLGNDLPLIDDEVTIEQLLGHRSGIGDYLDEEAGSQIGDYLLSVPVHNLATTEQFLQVSARTAVLLLQQRLRRARAAGRTGQRHPLS